MTTVKEIREEFERAINHLATMARYTQLAEYEKRPMSHAASAALSLAHGFHVMAAQELEQAGLTRAMAHRLVRKVRISAQNADRSVFRDGKIQAAMASISGNSERFL